MQHQRTFARFYAGLRYVFTNWENKYLLRHQMVCSVTVKIKVKVLLFYWTCKLKLMLYPVPIAASMVQINCLFFFLLLRYYPTVNSYVIEAVKDNNVFEYLLWKPSYETRRRDFFSNASSYLGLRISLSGILIQPRHDTMHDWKMWYHVKLKERGNIIRKKFKINRLFGK